MSRWWPEVNQRPAPEYSTCTGCLLCETACPYQAIGHEDIRGSQRQRPQDARQINPGLCQGCGTCVSLCRTKAIDLHGYSNEQVFAEIMSL